MLLYLSTPSDGSLVSVNYFFRRVASSQDVTEAPQTVKGRCPDVVGRFVVPGRANVIAGATREAPGETQRAALAGTADTTAARSSRSEPR